MATPKIMPQTAPQDVRVHIGCDAAGKITVEPDPFWIYRCEDEQVKWVCVQHHEHGDANDPCFKVDFDKTTGSPFNDSHFEGHRRALSGRPTSKAKDNQRYKYSVTVGKQTLDPDGGVKP
ncbi:MAG: hypothetical protein LAN61_12150 [Acidobacteriia bacterium]|nr:hypothetical protein [Terriglobia bacterium]